MGKIDKNKQIKRESLLETAFQLFTSKGIHKTSISDIVDNAGVAKNYIILAASFLHDVHTHKLHHYLLYSHTSSSLIRRLISHK